jgi:hypothetical protein
MKMKFNELQDKEKIRHVKDMYSEILGEIVANKKEIDKYMPITTEPVFKKPDLVDASAAGSKERNELILKAAQVAFKKEMEAFEEKKLAREKALEKLASVKEKEDCICEQRELDIDVNFIVPEFEVFIDFARTRAEGQTYP